MKKVVRLSEQDLVKLIKRTINEQIDVKYLTAPSDATQTVKIIPNSIKPVTMSNPLKKTDMGYSKSKPVNSIKIPTISELFKNILLGHFELIGYLIRFVRNTFGSTYRVKLIFPKEGWETKATEALVKAGIITAAFTSIESAIKIVNNLKKNKIKADELVIGSHGNGSKILITQKGDEYNLNETFLSSLKDLVTSNTTVFFTACRGADYLYNLVSAANTLGVGVYGAAGVYNYITNNADKGYYYCKPMGNISEDLMEERDIIYSGYGFRIHNDGTAFIEGFYTTGMDPKIEIIFTPESFNLFGFMFKKNTPISFVDFKTGNWEVDYYNQKGSNIYEHWFYINPSSFFNMTDEFKNLDRLVKDKELIISKKPIKQSNFGSIFKSAFEKGLIKIMINGKDLKSLPPIKGYHKLDDFNITNKQLLKNGVCKKIASPPITWINSTYNMD